MNTILTNGNNNKVIVNLIDLIKEFAVIIYQRENKRSYELLINIIDLLDSIIQIKSTLLEKNTNHYELTNKFPDLLVAVENNDNVLISDILKYEIKPILEKFICHK